LAATSTPRYLFPACLATSVGVVMRMGSGSSVKRDD
jgi:hypothetical protein